jgi:hypothetical protein
LVQRLVRTGAWGDGVGLRPRRRHDHECAHDSRLHARLGDQALSVSVRRWRMDVEDSSPSNAGLAAATAAATIPVPDGKVSGVTDAYAKGSDQTSEVAKRHTAWSILGGSSLIRPVSELSIQPPVAISLEPIDHRATHVVSCGNRQPDRQHLAIIGTDEG